jgi:hypothetical protein
MTPLILKHASKIRLGAIDWGPNDFDVLDADRCIGRIFLSPASPPEAGVKIAALFFRTVAVK